MKKILLITLLVIVVGVAGLLSYVKFVLPDVGDAPDITIESTPERVERGRYLVESVSACIDCHTERDWAKFPGPMKSARGAGGEVFDQNMGLPGKYVSKNITPAGIGDWTDGEVLRAIASGVNKDGQALFPIMPHPLYGTLDKEDVYSIITYLRTIPAIERENEPSSSDFPMNFIINTIPQPANFTARPDKSDKVNYGKYMFTAAGCNECHTAKDDKGQPLEGMYLAGGFEFALPSGIVRSANITSHEGTGIGSWTENAFVNRFKMYGEGFEPTAIGENGFNTVMPWMVYASMEEEDLRAIFTYLKTVPAVDNQVTLFTPGK